MTTQTVRTGTSRRKRLFIGAALVAVVAAVGVLVWFQPQKLFIDDTVDEAAPGRSETFTDDGTASDDAPMKDDATTAETLSGSFSSLAHETTGEAIVQTSGGQRFLRLEDLETSNGPDVRVYLSAGDADAYGKDFVDLGGLKGNKGSQNYLIPNGTDLERYDTAVIWCRRFTVAFGAAELG